MLLHSLDGFYKDLGMRVKHEANAQVATRKEYFVHVMNVRLRGEKKMFDS